MKGWVLEHSIFSFSLYIGWQHSQSYLRIKLVLYGSWMTVRLEFEGTFRFTMLLATVMNFLLQMIVAKMCVPLALRKPRG